jgi:hypothetical protein
MYAHPLITTLLLLIAAILGFIAFMRTARAGLRIWDERLAERESQRRVSLMRRYSMTDLRPARKA